MRRLDPIYPITTVGKRSRYTHVELAKFFLQGGAKQLQVRAKNLEDGPLYRQLEQIQELCKTEGANLIVNDRVALALASGAAGVHLGQNDLPVKAARKLLGEQAVIGLSTHTWQQFLDACHEPISYLAVGPIFPTTSKRTPYPALGLDFLCRVSRQSPFPVVAIGGITLSRVKQVWETGAASAAVISDINHHPQPAERIRLYRKLAQERRI